MPRAEPQLAFASSGGTRPPDDPPPHKPLLDLSDPAIAACIEAAKRCGTVTFGALNAVLPQVQTTCEQIEAAMATLSDMGIAVVDGDNAG